MSRDPTLRLEDIVAGCERLAAYTADLDTKEGSERPLGARTARPP